MDSGLPARHHQPNRLYHYLGGGLAKAGLVRNVYASPKTACVLGLNWASETRLFPVTYTREIIPWITDCWPPQFEKWHQIFRRHAFRHVFFSARDCIKVFAARHPHICFHWLPEAVEPDGFDPSRPLPDRDWGVFEMGRKHPGYHAALKQALVTGVQHVHDRFVQPGLELREALARTQILICFPKSVSLPREASGVETLTPRYLEGMASGCLLVGQAPHELVDLFGYNPVVEVDWHAPQQQIQNILARIGDYQSLVNRNRQQLQVAGTFTRRAAEMLSILRAAGYSL